MSVSLKEVRITVENTDHCGDRYVVTPIWSGVDREVSYAASCGKNLKLAKRLAACFLSGKAFANVTEMTDVNGKTFVNFTNKIFMRQANADLKRMGF